MRNEGKRWAGRGARAGAVLSMTLAAGALAGGEGENLLLIIDPADAASMYLGNYYKAARNIPDANIVYLQPGAADYPAFVAHNLAAVAGHIDRRGTWDHIDFVFVAPTTAFYVYSPGLVTDGCSPVGKLSMSGLYGSAFISSLISPGPISSQVSNGYNSSSTTTPRAFDSNVSWLQGAGSTSGSARRYYIAGMIGKLGQNGNTIQEIKDMIDRSVLADASRPSGTFYFMDNPADPDRNVRAGTYTGMVNTIIALNMPGVTAVKQQGLLPTGADGLGIMCGFAVADIPGSPLVLRPGAFCDHLTSWACAFDIDSQTKASEWIRKGASGTGGAVEEPCNYPGKFPGARLHANYLQGLNLGESWFRSTQYFPFQMLFLGDPLTRTWAYVPQVGVTGLGTGPLSGTVVLTPEATTDKPGASIALYDLHIDGKLTTSANFGSLLTLDTTALDDGWHEMRVIAYERTLIKTPGAWIGGITVNNHGRSAAMNVQTNTGRLSTIFQFNITAQGGPVREVRVLCNGRVIGTSPTPGRIDIAGMMMGAGPVRAQPEVLFADGTKVLGEPVALSINYDFNGTQLLAPRAFDMTRIVTETGPFSVELPATYDTDVAFTTYTIVTPPAKVTLSGSGNRGYRVATPIGTPKGIDTFTFRASTAWGVSQDATVTLIFPCPADFNGDGFLDFFDADAFTACFEGGECPPGKTADYNGDDFVDFFDLDAFIADFEAGC